MRKHLKKNNFGQFLSDDAISNYAEQMSKDYFAQFPDVDLDDLISILMPKLYWAKTMTMMEDVHTNGLTVATLQQLRKE